jgi:hypothetical protein
MNSKHLIVALSLSYLSVACGSGDEVERADKKRAEVEDENKILKEENASLENLVQNMFMTETNVWAATKALVGYQVADSSCTDIGFTLPTSTQFAEFKSEVYDVNADWQVISIERFHQKDLTLQMENGFAICRRDHKSDAPL